MIFGKGYDESLLMMLYSDNENRDRIRDFVKSIPDKLYDQIKHSVSLCQYYKEMDGRIGVTNNIELHGSVETSDRILYWFLIDSYCSKMTLGYSIYNGYTYDETFEISLFPYSEKLTHAYKNILVGSLRNNCNNTSVGMPIYSVVNYDLRKDTFGWKVTCSSKKRESSKRINPFNIADKITIDNIMHRNGVNRLVRRKNSAVRGNK